MTKKINKTTNEYGLTDAQIAREREFMEGLGPISVGALLLPPLWGPAHGLWITILFYPAWVFADNTFYAAVTNPSALSIGVAIFIALALVAVTLVFARLSNPYAAHRAARLGKTKEQYRKSERIWAICGVIAAVVIVAFATYYNLCLR